MYMRLFPFYEYFLCFISLSFGNLEMSVYDNSKNMKLRLFIYSYIKNKLFLCSKYISTHQDQNYFLGKVIPLKIKAFKKYNFSWKLYLQYWFVQKLIDMKYFFQKWKKVENLVIIMIFPHEIILLGQTSPRIKMYSIFGFILYITSSGRVTLPSDLI